MKIFALTPIGCQVRGSEIRPYLEKISNDFPPGTYNPDGIMHQFMTGTWTCWIVGHDVDAPKGVAASCVYPDMLGCRVAKILFLVGDDIGVLGMKSIMAQFIEKCEEAGIARIETNVRKGLTRVLGDWDREYSMITKILKNPHYPDYSLNDKVPNTTEVGRA